MLINLLRQEKKKTQNCQLQCLGVFSSQKEEMTECKTKKKLQCNVKKPKQCVKDDIVRE